MVKKIKAPTRLCLYNAKSRKETLEFVASLYEYNEPRLKLDFSKTEEVTGAAAILLFAHINAIQLQKNDAGYFIFDCQKSPIYRSHFLKKDLLKAFRAGSKSKLDQLEESCLFQSGTAEQLSLKRAHILKTLRHTLEIDSPLKVNAAEIYPKLQMAISELLINITNHAYYDVDAEKRWWQLMWYNEEKKQFTLFLYDLGVGIETSYKEHSTEKIPEPFCLSADPVYYFRQALSSGKSRFVGDGRGFGLARIISLVENNKPMSMVLFSSVFICDGSKDDAVTYELNDVDIPGTLFELNYVLS